jgi:hypothetical protein
VKLVSPRLPPRHLNFPTGWPKDLKLKELGRYVNFYMDMSLGGFATYPMSQILGWSLEEITVLVGQMRAAINDQKNFPNGDMYVFLMQNFACLLTISIGMSPTARSYCREWACG